MANYYSIVLLIFSQFIIPQSFASNIDFDIHNKNVDRTIDLTSQLVKISYKITLEHTAKKNINSYTFPIADDYKDKLSFISIKDSAKKEIKLDRANVEDGQYTITLPNGTPTQVIYIETVFTKSLLPYPTQIDQSDKQLVRYFGNVYFYSPYKTITQKTTFHLSTKNIESFTNIKPVQQSDTTLTYGPYDNIAGNIKLFKFPFATNY